MKKLLLFAKRNFLEMIRDPLLYIFCAGFPILMFLMFQIINKYTEGNTPMFNVKALVPGIIMFSFSLLMLMSSLLVSKDRTSAFLKRLFSSPIKQYQFLLGYLIPTAVVGLVQIIIGIVLGYVFGAIDGTGFVSFGGCMLLIVIMLPILITCLMLGILFGTILNDKSAPGICSIFISASGVLGGAWMPLETMGDFETICGYLPFYPTVYLGRIVTGATYTQLPEMPVRYYSFDEKGIQFVIVILAYMVVSSLLALFVFDRKMKSDIV